MGRFIKMAPVEEPIEEDPLSGIANLFDVSIVFIVGLVIALFSNYGAGALFDLDAEVTVVRTDEQGLQEVLIKKGATVQVFKKSGTQGSGDGTRLGTAYQLENGQVIYVPEAEATAPESDGETNASSASS